MPSCPDCSFIEQQVEGNSEFITINIGQDVSNLKKFLKLRDKNAAFDEAKHEGYIGIPCFELENGQITLSPEEVGLKSRTNTETSFCKLDGSGC